MSRGESSRDELFFIYGIIVSVIILVIFFTNVERLSDFDDVKAEVAADDLMLTIDAAGVRAGSTYVPFEVTNLDGPNATIRHGELSFSYLGSLEDGHQVQNAGFTETRSLLVRTDPDASYPARVHQAAVRSEEGLVSIVEQEPCSREASRVETIGDPISAYSVTVMSSDVSVGCVEFEEIRSLRSGEAATRVQRVIVPADAISSEVVILAR
jgi:hypothetical protein